MSGHMNEVQQNIFQQFRSLNRDAMTFGFRGVTGAKTRVFKPKTPLLHDGPNNLTFSFVSGDTLKNYYSISFGITYEPGPDTYAVTINRYQLSNDAVAKGIFDQFKTNDIYFDQLKIADLLLWAEGQWVTLNPEGV